MVRTTASAAVVAGLLAIAACSKDPEVAKQEYLRSGDDYYAQKKFREAIIEYRNAVDRPAVWRGTSEARERV
jgi:hypothetical protein